MHTLSKQKRSAGMAKIMKSKMRQTPTGAYFHISVRCGMMYCCESSHSPSVLFAYMQTCFDMTSPAFFLKTTTVCEYNVSAITDDLQHTVMA